MGTNVISGRATALVLVVGDETMMGAIEQTINTYDEPTSFERNEYHLLAPDSAHVSHGTRRLCDQWPNRR